MTHILEFDVKTFESGKRYNKITNYANSKGLNIPLYITSTWYVSTKNKNGIQSLKKTWNIFLMFCFMKGCGPFAKVIDQNN